MDQNLLMEIQEGHGRFKELEEKIEVVDKQISELQIFERTLEDLKECDSQEILSSLGKGVFAKTKVEEKKLFVDVGSGILVRKSIDETKEVILDQARKLSEMRLQLTGEHEALGSELEDLVKKIENPGN